MTNKEYEEALEYLEKSMQWNIECKENAEKSLEFLMEKFVTLYDWKKYFIAEIKARQKEIDRVNKILKQNGKTTRN